MNEECKTNPFAMPIASICAKIRSICWSLPYFPQIFQLFIQLFILVLLCFLYCTVGIVFNCYLIIRKLLSDSRNEFKNADLIGKSAYALMAGIYLLIITPFWVIVMPFMLLGWLWDRMSWFGILLYLLLVEFLVFFFLHFEEFIGYCRDNFVFPLFLVIAIPFMG